MPEKLTTLETRKKLLIAESELNRTLMVQELEELREAAAPIKAAAGLVSSGFSMIKAFRSERRASRKSSPPGWRATALRLLLDLAGMDKKEPEEEEETEEDLAY